MFAGFQDTQRPGYFTRLATNDKLPGACDTVNRDGAANDVGLDARKPDGE